MCIKIPNSRTNVSELSPFVVAIDTREQLPFDFVGLTQRADRKNARLLVRTARATLATGDYSIEGMETRIAIERKSLADLYASLTQERPRFLREVERLAALEVSAIIVEAGWQEIAIGPENSRANPRSIVGSILALQQRFPTVAWLTAGNRTFAAGLCYRSLERFWRDVQDNKRPAPTTGQNIAQVADKAS